MPARQRCSGYLAMILSAASGVLLAAENDRPPSMAFLEYLGSEESMVDGEYTSPVDLDLERYLPQEESSGSNKNTSESEDE